MRKKIIVKLLVLSLLVGGLCQWSGGSKAKAASSYGRKKHESDYQKRL